MSSYPQNQPPGGGEPPFGQGGGYGAGGYWPPSGGHGPGAGYGPPGPVGEPPNNQLLWAILATVLCCLPLGIVSIVYAAQVNSKWGAGDVAGAHAAAAAAKKWALWAFIVGILGYVLYILFFVLLGWGALMFPVDPAGRPGGAV